MIKFSFHLKNLRKINKISQINLSIETGIPKNSIYKYEKGDWLPLIQNCNKLAETLKTNKNELFLIVENERLERRNKK